MMFKKLMNERWMKLVFIPIVFIGLSISSLYSGYKKNVQQLSLDIVSSSKNVHDIVHDLLLSGASIRQNIYQSYSLRKHGHSGLDLTKDLIDVPEDVKNVRPERQFNNGFILSPDAVWNFNLKGQRIGNITTSHPLINNRSDLAAEMSIMPDLAGQFATILELNSKVIWAYYHSQSQFLYAAPYISPIDYVYAPELADQEILAKARVKNNKDRSLYWSEPVEDGGGRGVISSLHIPIDLDGRHVGLVALDILIDDMNSVLRQKKIKASSLMLLSEKWNVIGTCQIERRPEEFKAVIDGAFQQKEIHLNQIAIKKSSFSMNEMAKEEVGPIFHNGHIVSKIYVPGTPWHLWSVTSYADFILMTVKEAMVPLMVIGFCLVLYLGYLKESLLSAALNRANQAKTEFLSNMSHDLRTPLNAIIGFSEALQLPTMRKDKDKVDEYINHINSSGVVLLDLVNELLDIAKIESGKQEVEITDTNVNDLIKQSISMESVTAAQRNISLSFTPSEEMMMHKLDPRMTLQTVNNILSNAIKYTPSGGFVSIRCDYANNGALKITVKDNGKGMDKDTVERVLRPFEQADNKYRTYKQGTGLGLYLCAKFMEMHGGELIIESKVGNGTSVTAIYPAILD